MAVDQISRAMAAKALQNDGMLNGRVVTDITLGDSTTPLPKTDGVVNILGEVASALFWHTFLPCILSHLKLHEGHIINIEGNL